MRLNPMEERFMFDFGTNVQLEGHKAEIEKTNMIANDISHSLRWTVNDKEIRLEGYGKNRIEFKWRVEKLIPAKEIKEKGRWVRTE